MKSKRNYTRTMKIVRRIHMYTGLILLPWVIFFGFSGMLFNHPEWFGPVDVVARHSAASVDKISTFSPLRADAIANAVVENLNADAPDTVFKRVSNTDAVIEGKITYQCETDQGRAMVILSPNHGSANVRVFPPSEPEGKTLLDGKHLSVATTIGDETEETAQALLAEAGLKPQGPLELSTRGGAEVRFSIESPEGGAPWNVSYSLSEGKISSKASDAPHGMDFYSVVSRLHKTHHYPDRVGARWLWTVLADTTGITMVFWGISGAFMWWQIKPTRLIGIAGLSVAAVLAVAVFSGTFENLTYNGSSGRRGPARSAEKGSPPNRPNTEKGKPEKPNNTQKLNSTIQTSQ